MKIEKGFVSSLGESLGVEIYTTRKSFAGKSLDRVNV
jgi:hypothetical protein